MCGPADCNKTELEDVASSVNATFTYLLAMIGMNPPTGEIYLVNSYYERNINGWFLLPIITGLLIFLGTLIDFYPQLYDKSLSPDKIKVEQGKEGYETLLNEHQETLQNTISLLNDTQIEEFYLSPLIKFFLCFSLKKNLAKLIDERHMAFNHPNFNMFNGLCFLSVCWIVLGHGYIIRLVYAQNPEYIRIFQFQLLTLLFFFQAIMLKHQFFPQIVQGGDWGVDACFWATGFILTYFVLQRFDKIRYRKDLITIIGSIFYSLFTRIFQIWPLLAVALVINWQLLQYMMPRGPYAKQFLDNMSADCRVDWWKKILFIENWTNCDPQSSCLGWFIFVFFY